MREASTVRPTLPARADSSRRFMRLDPEFSIHVFTPRGKISVSQPSLAAGQRRQLVLVIDQSHASQETTNHFVRELVRDLHSQEAWMRELAAFDLANSGEFPSAAAALASVFALDTH